MKKCVFCQVKAKWQCSCSQDYMCQEHLQTHLIKEEKHTLIPLVTAQRITKAKNEIYQRIKLIKSVKKKIKVSTKMFLSETQLLSKSALDRLNELKGSYEELLEASDFNQALNLNIDKILTTKLSLKCDKSLEVGQDVMNYYMQVFVYEEKCYEGPKNDIESGSTPREVPEMPLNVNDFPYKIEGTQSPLTHSVDSKDFVQFRQALGNDTVLIEDETNISSHCPKIKRKHRMGRYQINCSSIEPLVLINIYNELVQKLNTKNNFINFGNIILNDPTSAIIFLRFKTDLQDKNFSWRTEQMKFQAKRIIKFPEVDKESLNDDNFLQWCGEFQNSISVIFGESTDELEKEISEDELRKISEKQVVKNREDETSRKKRK